MADTNVNVGGALKAAALISAIGGVINGSVPKVPSFDHGGDVTHTELALVHKGEHVDSAHNVSLYRAMHHLNKGGLHRALGVPEGESIPQDKLEAAKHSSNAHVAHMAHFAGTMEGFHHGK